eukprot:172443-Pleurochrysis_carterae.AAC.3
MTKTQGSEPHCLKPNLSSRGKSERCQRLPACAMPQIGFSTRHIRGRPSAPTVAYPGSAWQ